MIRAANNKDGDVYLRSLMHLDRNIRYANYQSEDQMSAYLTSKGFEEVISDTFKKRFLIKRTFGTKWKIFKE